MILSKEWTGCFAQCVKNCAKYNIFSKKSILIWSSYKSQWKLWYKVYALNWWLSTDKISVWVINCIKAELNLVKMFVTLKK